MKPGIIATIAVILLAGLGGYFYMKQAPNNTGNPQTSGETGNENKLEIESKETIDTEKTIGQNDTTAKTPDSQGYKIYNKSDFESTTGKKRVLFFYANWCETCRPADADFKANESSFPEDLVLFRVNYNDPDTDQEEKDLARKYGITYQHTFVLVDGEGNVIKKWNGGQTEKLLSSVK